MEREYPLDRIRNIGIIAHIDAGKTTTTERILYYTGKTHRIGSVDDGTTVTDWMEQERERGITITAAAITAVWHDYTINVIDTPGMSDFIGHTIACFPAVETVVIVIDALKGIESETRRLMRVATERNLPRVILVNKIDVAEAGTLAIGQVDHRVVHSGRHHASGKNDQIGFDLQLLAQQGVGGFHQ